MSSQALGNLTSGFIDLATFDEIEKYLYGGLEAVTYFVREVRKSTWFTVVPTVLSRVGGTPTWGSQCYFQISRAGDYLLHTWFRANIGSVANAAQGTRRFRWTRNFGHNLIKECTITFNDLVAARFDNYFLDFWAAFTVPAGKQAGYNQMIGNTTAQTSAAAVINEFTVNIPLPLFYTRDSGVALPTAALPYNDMRINLWFRNWDELLNQYTVAANVYSRVNAKVTAPQLLNGQPPTFKDGNVWANYAIVSNDERKRMGCAPRDILIEQVQTAPQSGYEMNKLSGTNVDIRFSHSVKALGMLPRNTLATTELSNYTAADVSVADADAAINPSGVTAPGKDPISNMTLFYENTQRLSAMPSEFYSQVEPYYKGIMTNIPTETGYHLYSYALDLTANDPMGSTNYGKLTNVSINAASNYAAADPDNNADFELIILAVNHNIIRISGGALGFPVL